VWSQRTKTEPGEKKRMGEECNKKGKLSNKKGTVFKKENQLPGDMTRIKHKKGLGCTRLV